MRQLDAAARYPGMILAAQRDRRIRRQHVARLGDSPLAHEDLPRHDECLCLGTALGEAALDEQLIGPLLSRPALLCRFRHALAGSMRSEEHTSELQSLMRISYAVF